MSANLGGAEWLLRELVQRFRADGLPFYAHVLQRVGREMIDGRVRHLDPEAADIGVDPADPLADQTVRVRPLENQG